MKRIATLLCLLLAADTQAQNWICTPDQAYQPATATWVSYNIVNGADGPSPISGNCQIWEDTPAGAFWYAYCNLNGIARPTQNHLTTVTLNPGSSGSGPSAFTFNYMCPNFSQIVSGQDITLTMTCTVQGVVLGAPLCPRGVRVS